METPSISCIDTSERNKQNEKIRDMKYFQQKKIPQSKDSHRNIQKNPIKDSITFCSMEICSRCYLPSHKSLFLSLLFCVSIIFMMPNDIIRWRFDLFKTWEFSKIKLNKKKVIQYLLIKIPQTSPSLIIIIGRRLFNAKITSLLILYANTSNQIYSKQIIKISP